MKNFKKILDNIFVNKEEVDDPWEDLEKGVDHVFSEIVYKNTGIKNNPEMIYALCELIRTKMSIVDRKIWRERLK